MFCAFISLESLIVIVSVLTFVGVIAWRQIKNPRKEKWTVITKWTLTLILLPIPFLGMSWAMQGGQFMVIFFMVGVVVPCCVFVGLIWAPSMAHWMVSPITNAMEGNPNEIYKKPLYSMAEARRKNGLYWEAIEEVEKQLEEHPGDFDGLMLIAEIQAVNLGDLQGACQTLEEAINDPEHMQWNAPIALNRMADWHLKLADKPEDACKALNRIKQMLPGTEAAQLAEQRLAHMEVSDNLLKTLDEMAPLLKQDSSEEGPLKLSGFEPKDRRLSGPAANRADVAVEACLKQLERHPEDIATREELARLYASEYGKHQMAIDELQYLLAIKTTNARQKAKWLNQTANHQVKSSQPLELVRETLERIVLLAPEAAAAMQAKKRISYLNIEIRNAHKKSRVIKLGDYDQDIGLKN